MKRIKTPWDFLNSVFAKYKPDTENLLNECFQFDWENTKIEKLMKNDETIILECKNYLRKNYKLIRDAYKFYSGMEPQGRLPCIGATTFGNMISQIPDLIDGVNLKSADVDLSFVAANSIRANYPNYPDRQLIRFNLLEAVVRICLEKYFNKKLVTTRIEALKISFETYF